MTWLQSVLRWIQLKPRFLVGISVCCFALIAIPQVAAEWAGLASLISPMRGWLFIIGLVSFVFSCVQLLPSAVRRVHMFGYRRKLIQRMDALSQEELELLAYCLSRNRRTLVVSLDSQVANVASGLSQKGIMDVGAPIQHVLAVPHTVTDQAWWLLLKRRDAFLDRAKKRHSQAGLQKIFRQLDHLASGRDGALPNSRWDVGALR